MSLDLLLAVCVPLGLAVWFTAEQSRRELERSSRQNLELLAGVTGARLDQLLVDSACLAAKVARDDAVIARCQVEGQPTSQVAEAVQRDLAAVVQTNPAVASIFVIGRNLRGLASTNPENVNQDLSFREYAREAVAGRPHVSDPIVGKTSRKAGIYVAVPVAADGAPTVIGAVVIKLDGERIWEIVDHVTVGAHGFALLADRHGVVLSHPDKSRIFSSFAPLSADVVGAIDPQRSYSRDNIPSLDMPELQGPATAGQPEGTADFTVADGSKRSRWVAGFASMGQKSWRVFVVEPEAQFAAAMTQLLRQQALFGLVVAVIAAALALWRARGVVRPVLALTAAADKVAAGDLTARAPQYADDEVGGLAASFNAMVPQLQERAHLQQALAVATEVQQALLPEKDPIDPRLDVAGRSKYCDETGGDYYDFIEVIQPGGKNLLIAVGDVTGHGIASALLMAAARGAVRAHADRANELAHVMSRVNRVLSEDSRHNRFMTLALFVLDPEAGTLRWASAGHDPPFVYHAADKRFEELKGSDLMLGVSADMEYEVYTRQGLRSGDVIFVGTDGIWEMHDGSNQQFGKERLRQVLEDNADHSAAEIASSVERALAEFRKDVAPQDDVTFVIVKLR